MSWPFLSLLWHSGISLPLLSTGRKGQALGLGVSGGVPTTVSTTKALPGYYSGPEGLILPYLAVTYTTRAGLYANQIPEHFFPGKCDIWFQAHGVLPILVVASAFIHSYGLSDLQNVA